MTWKYWVRRKVEPKSAKKTSVMVAEAAEKRGFLKKRTSSMAEGDRRSQPANRVRLTPPTAKPASTTGADHPLSGAWMTAYSTPTRPTIDSPAPMGSSGLSSRALELGT